LSWNLTAPFRAVLIARRRILDFFREEVLRAGPDSKLPVSLSKATAGTIPDRERLALSVVQKETGGNISGGPFKGMKYVGDSRGSAFYPKLMGTYELELHGIIERLCQEQFDVLLNIGSGEGYYSVGMAMRCQRLKVIAAEEDEGRRKELFIELARK